MSDVSREELAVRFWGIGPTRCAYAKRCAAMLEERDAARRHLRDGKALLATAETIVPKLVAAEAEVARLRRALQQIKDVSQHEVPGSPRDTCANCIASDALASVGETP